MRLLKPVYTDESFSVYTLQEFEECYEFYARHGYTLLYLSSRNFSEKLCPIILVINYDIISKRLNFFYRDFKVLSERIFSFIT